MEYSKYFSKIYEDNKDTTNDAVEDKKHFKNDFYNLVLDTLKIREDYDKHFFAKRELTSEDLTFLDEFTNFILSDSNKDNSSQESTTLARGTGRKHARKNGRDIINKKYDLYANELFSIYSKFEQALKNDKNTNFRIDYNPIVSRIFKIIAKNYITSISEGLIKTIDSLSAPAFSCFFTNLSSDIKKLVVNCKTILDGLEDLTPDGNTPILVLKPEEIADGNLLKSKLKHMYANEKIRRNPLSEDSIKIQREMKILENKAEYRKNQKDYKNKQDELDKTIAKDNLELLSSLDIDPSDFHYKEKYEQYVDGFQEIYDFITVNMPDLIIHFNKTKK